MTDDDKNFLARWSQRKRDANKTVPAEAEPAHAEPITHETKAIDEQTDSETEAFDLATLPKLEDLTANSDIKVFFRQGVPESLRNAALRKAWALDPAIRNYVSPALDYAYDWNTPGGVPGTSELAAGTDIAKLVSRIIGSPEPATSEPADDVVGQALGDSHLAGGGAQQTAQATEASDVSAVRLSADPQSCAQAKSPEGAAIAASDGKREENSPAPQQDVRRHGAAKPRL